MLIEIQNMPSWLHILLIFQTVSFSDLFSYYLHFVKPIHFQHFNQETGQWYYVNTKTNTTSFEAPLINTDGPSFVKASNTAGGGGHSGSGGMIGASRGDGVAGGASLPVRLSTVILSHVIR